MPCYGIVTLSYVLRGRPLLSKVLGNSYGLANLVRDSEDRTGCFLKRILGFEYSLVVFASERSCKGQALRVNIRLSPMLLYPK